MTKAGFKKDALEIIENVAASKITSRLVEAGYEKDKAQSYGEAMQKGGTLIVAEAPDDKADEALDMIHGRGDRRQSWQGRQNRLRWNLPNIKTPGNLTFSRPAARSAGRSCARRLPLSFG